MTAMHLSMVLAVVVAYVSGSIPSAYLAGKWRGIDLRRHGSGNLGATNVVRVLGPKIGAAVFLVDTLKGFLPVFCLSRLVPSPNPDLFALALGAAAVFGHVRPLFLGFRRGGKGVATAGGVFLGLAPAAMAIAFAVFLVVFIASRYVSLASLCAAVALPIALAITGHPPGDPFFAGSLVIGAFVLYTHRANIGRLRRGEEHKFVRARPGSGATDARPSRIA